MTPEQLSEEHRLIGQTAAEFIDQEVLTQRRAGSSRRTGR